MRVTAERYLSLQEVGDELGVSDQTVRRWVKAGELTAYKPGKEYRIKGSDLEEFLQTREVSPKAHAPLPLDSGGAGLDITALQEDLEEHLVQIRQRLEERLHLKLERAKSEGEQHEALKDFRYAYIPVWLLLADFEKASPGTVTPGVQHEVGLMYKTLAEHPEGIVQRKAAERDMENVLVRWMYDKDKDIPEDLRFIPTKSENSA